MMSDWKDFAGDVVKFHEGDEQPLRDRLTDTPTPPDADAREEPIFTHLLARLIYDLNHLRKESTVGDDEALDIADEWEQEITRYFQITRPARGMVAIPLDIAYRLYDLAADADTPDNPIPLDTIWSALTAADPAKDTE